MTLKEMCGSNKPVRLTKLSEPPDAVSPNNRPIGEVTIGRLFKYPSIGGMCVLYDLHTSIVRKIISETDSKVIFETKNSTYKLECIEEPVEEKCPDGLTPDGEICPKCGKKRLPSGVDGGMWVHVTEPAALVSDSEKIELEIYGDSLVRFSPETIRKKKLTPDVLFGVFPDKYDDQGLVPVVNLTLRVYMEREKLLSTLSHSLTSSAFEAVVRSLKLDFNLTIPEEFRNDLG